MFSDPPVSMGVPGTQQAPQTRPLQLLQLQVLANMSSSTAHHDGVSLSTMSSGTPALTSQKMTCEPGPANASPRLIPEPISRLIQKEDDDDFSISFIK